MANAFDTFTYQLPDDYGYEAGGLNDPQTVVQPPLAASPLSSYPVMDKTRFTGEWEQLPEAPAYQSFNYLPGYTLAPKKDIPALSHISPAEQERILWLNTASGDPSGAYGAGAAIPYALNPQGIPYGQGTAGSLSGEGNLPIPEHGRITPEWLDPATEANKYTKFGVAPYTDVEQAQVADLDVGSYEDAFRDIKLKYGKEGLKKLAENLNTAFPEGDYKLKTEITDSSRGDAGQPHSSYISYTDPKTGVGRLGGSIIPHIYERMVEGGFMTPEAYDEKLRPDFSGAKIGGGIPAATYNPEDPYGNVLYEKYVPEYNPARTRVNELAPIVHETLAQLAGEPAGRPIASQTSPAAGVLTATEGGITGTDLLDTSGVTDQPSPKDPPISAVTGKDAPTPEETAFKGFINDLATSGGGKPIFSVSGEEVASDPPLSNFPWAPYTYEKPAQGLVTSMPLVSTTDNPANKYLQGGADAFSISGPQGYADVRQQLLGGSDRFTGPSVPWKNLGEPVLVDDQYYGANFPEIPEDILGSIAIPKPGTGTGEKFDWETWRKNKIIADIPEGAFHPGNDTWGVGINKHYGDLETAQKEQLMGDVEAFWGDDWGTGLYSDSPEGSAEDFTFFEHPGVNKNIDEGFGKIKKIFSKAGELATKGKNLLAGVINELTRFTEREGGRGSTTFPEGEPWGLSAKGILSILKLDFKDLEKQGYGDLQPAAFILASQHPVFLGLQIGNTLKDFVKDAINVSTYDSPKYDPLDSTSTAPAYNNAVEFTGNLLRPVIKTVADFVLNDTTDASLTDKVKNAFGLDRVGFDQMYGPHDKDLSERSTFELGNVAMEEFLSRHDRPPEHMPTSGYEPTGEGTLTTPLKPDYTGQGVSAGTAPSPGSSLLPPVSSKTIEGGAISADYTPTEENKLLPSSGKKAQDEHRMTRKPMPADVAGDVKSLTVEQLNEIINNPIVETDALPSDEFFEPGGGDVMPEVVDYQGGTLGMSRPGYGRRPSRNAIMFDRGGQLQGKGDLFKLEGRTVTGEPIEQLTGESLPKPPMPAQKLGKDELQARTEKLDKKIQEAFEVAALEEFKNSWDKGAHSAEYLNNLAESFIGDDLSHYGLGNPATKLDSIRMAVSFSQHDMNADAFESFSNRVNNQMGKAFSDLAFEGVDLNNLSGVNLADLSFPSQVWDNLALQPNYVGTLNVGDVQPDKILTKLQSYPIPTFDSANAPITTGAPVPEMKLSLSEAIVALGDQFKDEPAIRTEILQQMTGLTLPEIKLGEGVGITDRWGNFPDTPGYVPELIRIPEPLIIGPLPDPGG